MAVTGKSKQLALDTNVLFDLAANLESAHAFREAFLEKGYKLLISPTVIQETYFLYENGNPKQQLLAKSALENLLSWKIEPFDLKSVGHGITEQFSNRIRRKGLLPDAEMNDGLILAETSLAGIPILVMSDRHLLNIDESDLRICFDDSDMSTVTCFHPKKLYRAISH
jgi:predicted nucleic acid-binding protein